MALPDLFSRRKREALGQGSDVYSYDIIPPKLRNQVVQILQRALGPSNDNFTTPPGKSAYEHIVETLRREIGVFELSPRSYGRLDTELFNWMLNEDQVDHLIDGLELSFRTLEFVVKPKQYNFNDYAKCTAAEAIAELNARLQEAAIGYQYEGGQIVRVDSQVVHAAIVVPALQLLSDRKFRSAEREYRAAHEAYRAGDLETCLVECGKAFESVLKVIGAERRWPVGANDPAKRLLDAAFGAGFIEAALQAEFTALRSLLESAVPTVRNKMGGHGAGPMTRVVPRHVAAFQLHQTAAAILFLAQHHAATP